jgi:hypothetical protein
VDHERVEEVCMAYEERVSYLIGWFFWIGVKTYRLTSEGCGRCGLLLVKALSELCGRGRKFELSKSFFL